MAPPTHFSRLPLYKPPTPDASTSFDMDSITIDLETVTSPSPVNFWIWCSIGYSILGYALISFLIIRFAICKKFNNVVYRLIQVDLMINIGCHLFSMLSFRLQSLKVVIPFLKLIEYTFPGSFTLLMKSSFFFLHSQFLSIFVVNFSRILPFFHLGVYLKAKYPKWYYLVYGVAILFTSFLITWSCFEYFLDGNFYEISLFIVRQFRVTLDKGAADTTSYYPIRSEAADLKNVDDVLEVERGHKIRCKFSAPPRTKQLSIALERAEQE
ncbi:unnamed protein product [Caenorhabditis brenneri]